MKIRLALFLSLVLGLIPTLGLSQQRQQGEGHIWEKAAYGAIPGVTQVNLNGNNGAITTTFEPLWPESAAYVPLAAAMSAPYCASSDNTNDKAAGTGCLTMLVAGVTSTYAAFSETVTLNGQTSVVLATSNILFINSLTCLTAGSTFANTGTIRCGTGSNSSGVPAVVHAHMAIGFGKTQTAMYAVPASYSLLCRNFTVESYGVTAAQTAQFVIDRYVDPVAGKVLLREYVGILNQGGSSASVYPGIVKFAPKTVLVAQALSAASTGPAMFKADCLLISDAWAATAQSLF